jgi:hypothetical protein
MFSHLSANWRCYGLRYVIDSSSWNRKDAVGEITYIVHVQAGIGWMLWIGLDWRQGEYTMIIDIAKGTCLELRWKSNCQNVVVCVVAHKIAREFQSSIMQNFVAWVLAIIIPSMYLLSIQIVLLFQKTEFLLSPFAACIC